MSNNLNWTVENLQNLDPKYLRGVYDNLRGDTGSVIQFGETGTGFQPNYQITYSNNVKRTVSGISHKNFPQSDKLSLVHEEFNPDNISQIFKYDNIKKLLS